MNASASGDGRSPGPAQPGLLRSLNNRVVLELLIEHGTLSRSDVHALTGLSKPTASQLLQRLEESGLVRPSGFGDTGPGGRAPQLYRIVPSAGHAAAVDVRRGRARVRISDITGTVVVEQERETDPNDSGPSSAATIIASSCAEAGIAPAQLDAIVISVPGSYDSDSDALWYVDHLPGWQQPAVGAELRRLFPAASVSIENDVNLAAIAERNAASDDAESFFLFWLDDGIGGAIMIDGSLYRGSRGAAGEAAFLLSPVPCSTSRAARTARSSARWARPHSARSPPRPGTRRTPPPRRCGCCSRIPPRQPLSSSSRVATHSHSHPSSPCSIPRASCSRASSPSSAESGCAPRSRASSTPSC
ncbi:ROK family transcriptional regulator [Homoserinibacter gongjuensis]|uniref:ROK family transcriptional regulator n=1 Tax=Homoserinibacter gongjuensis TaxID=1162968 RepID=UPI0024E07D08|nr:ROK family transcriptional regulator [Homoserinibacter gongjuensis]